MVFSGEENYNRFTDYNDDNYKIKPLRLVKADELLKKYTDIWIKVINSITKNLIVDLSLLKCLKTTIRFYGDEATGFYGKKYLR